MRKKKFVLLPADPLILSRYKGTLYQGETTLKKGRAVLKAGMDSECRVEYVPATTLLDIIWFVLIIPVVILSVVLMIPIVLLCSRSKPGITDLLLDYLRPIIIPSFIENQKRTEKIRIIRSRKKLFQAEEDIPSFLNKLRQSRYQIALYGYKESDPVQVKQVRALLASGCIDRAFSRDDSDFERFLTDEVHPRDSRIVIRDRAAMDYWAARGFEWSEANRSVIQLVQPENPGQEAINGIHGSASFFFKLSYGDLNYYISSPHASEFNPKEVFFVGHPEDDAMRKTLVRNYEKWSEWMAREGYVLRIITIDRRSPAHIVQLLMPGIVFRVPELRVLTTDELQQSMLDCIDGMTDVELEQTLLDYLDLPEMPLPVLLRRKPSYDTITDNHFTYFQLPKNGQLEEAAMLDYVAQLKRIPDQYPAYSSSKWPEDGNVNNNDMFFHPQRYFMEPDEKELQEVPEDTQELLSIYEKISKLKEQQQLRLMAVLLQRLSMQLRESHPQLARALLRAWSDHDAPLQISRMKITREYKIYLVDYNNLEIPMYPLAKIIFLLFLLHPDGILFKNMIDYRAQLCQLYEKVTGRVITQKVRKSLDDLTDASNISIAQKVARIRASFRAFMPDHIADHYTITGKNAEPKKIILDRALLSWDEGTVGYRSVE